MLSLVIRPAPRLSLLLALLHGGAAACVVIVPLPGLLQVSLVVLLAAAASHAVWRHGLGRHPRAIRRLDLDAEGRVYLMDGSGQPQPARIQASSVVTPWLTVLDFATETGRRSLLLTPERVDAEAYRRLRVWLRWGWRPDTPDSAGGSATPETPPQP